MRQNLHKGHNIKINMCLFCFGNHSTAKIIWMDHRNPNHIIVTWETKILKKWSLQKDAQCKKVIRETQMKTTMRYHCISPEWMKWRINDTKRWQGWRTMEQLGLPHCSKHDTL